MPLACSASKSLVHAGERTRDGALQQPAFALWRGRRQRRRAWGGSRCGGADVAADGVTDGAGTPPRRSMVSSSNRRRSASLISGILLASNVGIQRAARRIHRHAAIPFRATDNKAPCRLTTRGSSHWLGFGGGANANGVGFALGLKARGGRRRFGGHEPFCAASADTWRTLFSACLAFWSASSARLMPATMSSGSRKRAVDRELIDDDAFATEHAAHFFFD